MSNEKTEKELIYELGSYAMELWFMSLNDPNELPFDDVQQVYYHFKIRAWKLKIHVPDLTKRVLNRQFLIEQTNLVMLHIDRTRTLAVSLVYHCSCSASLFFMTLTFCKTYKLTLINDPFYLQELIAHTRGIEEKMKHLTPERAPFYLDQLISLSKDLEEAIGDQLEEELYNICEDHIRSGFGQDLVSIKLRLKKKVCGLGSEILSPSPTGYKRSEVDPTRVITDECWAVSLVRPPDRSNPEHAFIVLEGKTGRRSKIWFADFVAAQRFGSVEPGTGEGKVRMESFESVAVAGQTSDQPLLFKCQRIIMDIKETDRWLYTTWTIARSTAENLIKNIKAQQQNPPRFHLLGNRSMFAEGAAELTGNPTGHNCFTFAKKMFHDLYDPSIQLLENDLRTWMMSATSGYLSRTWYKKPSFPPMLLFLAVIVVAYFLFKTMQWTV